MSESGSAGSFYLSRTGSTANPLTVNFTLGGTALNGTDYNTVAGSATIPAGASGVDVTITPVNDTGFEGTETIVLSLNPAGYGCGPAATMYLTDNETSTTLVSFAAPGAAGPESVSLVQIPVILSAPPTAPVTVEYLVDTGSRTASRVTSTVTRPCWLRLQRAGTFLSAYSSANGTTWTQVGSTQTMALSSEVLAGLAVSAKTDGSLSSATFDNFALTGSPTLQGRTIGFVNAQGSDSLASGVYTVAGSGAAIGGTEDECHFLAAPVSGDFTLTARVLTQSGGATAAQAGLMIRETPSHRARALYLGSIANAGLELLCRTGTVTTAFGAGVDFSLPAGTLTFNIGQTSNNIPLTVINDTIQDWDEQLTVFAPQSQRRTARLPLDVRLHDHRRRPAPGAALHRLQRHQLPRRGKRRHRCNTRGPQHALCRLRYCGLLRLRWLRYSRHGLQPSGRNPHLPARLHCPGHSRLPGERRRSRNQQDHHRDAVQSCRRSVEHRRPAHPHDRRR